MMDKVKKWFFEEDGENEEYNDFEEVEEVVTEEEAPKTSMFERPKSPRTTDVVNQLDAAKNSNLVLFEPRSYSSTQEIATYLKQKKAAVVNLHRLQKEQSKRVIDFLSGVIFAIDGDIQQIGPKIFLLTPKNISVSGTISMEDSED